jgi:hypothetical protein
LCSCVNPCTSCCGTAHHVRLGHQSIGDAGCVAITAAIRRHPGILTTFEGVDLGKSDPQLPLELQGQSNRAVLDYYRDLRAAAVVSRRCRVMLLGTGGVGKTTLAHRLVTGRPAAHSADVTHGVLQRTFLLAAMFTTAAFFNDASWHLGCGDALLAFMQTTGALTILPPNASLMMVP